MLDRLPTRRTGKCTLRRGVYRRDVTESKASDSQLADDAHENAAEAFVDRARGAGE
jgi:hypothetical protein